MDEIREILLKIKNKKQEIRNLVEQNKIDEAKEAKKELQSLQDKFEILQDIIDENKQNIINKLETGEGAKIIDKKEDEKPSLKRQIKAFVNVLVGSIKKDGSVIDEEDVKIVNSINEGTPEDGGLTVPQDIQTQIRERRKTIDDLEQYVNVESTTVREGSRVIEANADEVPWDDVEESAQFPDAPEPKFQKINYKVTKKGGILKITRELLQDTAENIMAYLTKYIAKKSRITRNAFIIKKVREATQGKEVAITGFDDLKDIFNEKLDPAIAATSVIITNQTGFNYLDKLKDKDGNYIMQKDVTDKNKKMLFGEYEVIKVSNKTLKSIEIKTTNENEDHQATETVTGYKHPVICGDLKEAITLFDRERISIELNELGGEYWKKDETGVKIRDRFDVQIMDENAVIMGEIETTV